jgi:hypothetical protein
VTVDNLRGREHLAMPVNVAVRDGLSQLRRVATALWVEGHDMDLAVLDPRRPSPRPQPRAGRRSHPIRLNLSGALVRMGEHATGLLALPTPRNGAP